MISSENKNVQFIIRFVILFIVHFSIGVITALLRDSSRIAEGGDVIQSLIFSLIMASIFQFTVKPKNK